LPQKWILDAENKKRSKTTAWCATEKIHGIQFNLNWRLMISIDLLNCVVFLLFICFSGANFCMMIDVSPVCQPPADPEDCTEALNEHTLHIRCGKRKQLLENGEDFFGHSEVVQRYAARAKQAFWKAADSDEVKWDVDRLKKLYVFGELFGGHYPSTSLPGAVDYPNRPTDAVQTGIWYCPWIDFRVFDMAIQVNPDDHQDSSRPAPLQYLDWSRTLEICDQVDLSTVPVMATGTLEEMLAFSPRFVTTIPQLLKLPPLTDSEAGGRPNWAEGVVIRPMQNVWVSSSSSASLSRALVKHKIPEFAEDARFNQTVKPSSSSSSSTSSLSSSSSQERTEMSQMLLFELLAMANSNRLASVLSKIGRLSAADRSEQSRALWKQALIALHADCLESFRDGFTAELESLKPQPHDWTDWEQQLTEECKRVIVQHVAKCNAKS
jgi:Rnl2 family RNA ligase